jgi:hypothetical protein
MPADLQRPREVARPPKTDAGPCPLCGEPLYGWLALPPATAQASVGMPVEQQDRGERVIDRCESCGVALERGRELDLAREWRLVAGEPDRIVTPNRASLQAWIGVEGWTGFDRGAGSLLLTPASLELLAHRNGERLGAVRTPVSWHSQAWMWQTLLNGLTFHPNFARELRAGRLRPSNSRGRGRFAVDLVVTVLGAPLVALVSIPLELVAALAGRGGEMAAASSVVSRR